MNTEREDFKQTIYELVNGSRNLEKYPLQESNEVKNEYESGSFCSKAYEEVYNANQRICEKLGTEENEDVECIISNLQSTTSYVSKKMYDYGELYAYRNCNTNKGKLITFYDNLPEQKKEKFMKLLSSLRKILNESDDSK